MIKRRFYREEHGDRNEEASDSSSSSYSETEIQESEEDVEDEVSLPQVQEEGQSCSTSSGYESEDSSGNEIDENASDTDGTLHVALLIKLDETRGCGLWAVGCGKVVPKCLEITSARAILGLLTNEDDTGTANGRQIFLEDQFSPKRDSELLKKQSNVLEADELVAGEFPACILKCKSVYKCRICPRIVCLNEESLRTHLQSKRHSRSEKLLNDGRLKAMLNSDGEMDHDETPAKQHAKIAALAQDNPKQKRGGRQRQHSRRQMLRKKDKKNESNEGKMRQSKENPAKKRRKSEN
ncbi:hypothetical protein FEM48_Zijuj04G0181800 [Ziziphus jujuba var. spinosa]|uniref:C2H2-type domain-containing protein n=1 Tax=Ziziphus jujuba var. spinosa TaxID=714518 RepID=A0A978VLE3_ZIZJJ|nr:hypothetical protein FEM48_Zijuj04G0181800 [Ziziphus jujuba var. spinosa]